MNRILPPLISARAIPRPSVIPRGRPRGAKRHGLRYERDFAKAVGASAVHGQWFEFEDAAGKHYCQTDVILDIGPAIVIFECKYTWVPEAAAKLEGLYRLVVEMAMGKPTLGVVVCKKLVRGLAEPIAAELPTAIALARPGRPSVLHWLGEVQLFVGARASLEKLANGDTPPRGAVVGRSSAQFA